MEKPTCEGEHGGEDDVDPGAVDVKHDPKVDGYAAQNGETAHKGPIWRVQGDLDGDGGTEQLFIGFWSFIGCNTWTKTRF